MNTKFYRPSLLIAAFFAAIFVSLPAHSQQAGGAVDKPNDRLEWEKLITKDPALGYVPEDRLQIAKDYAYALLQQKIAIPNVNWQERGPNNIGGRTRSLMFDPNDAANGYKKVWAASAGGGVWYNNDITNANSSWLRVNDFWDNIVISSVVYDPSNTQIFYVGTGDDYGDKPGIGILRSNDGGNSWAYLNATKNNNNFRTVQKVVVKSNGYVFAATNTGVWKSTDQGLNWTQVLSGIKGNDVAVASNGDLFATTQGTVNSIHKSPNASNGSAGTWTNLVNLGTVQRIKIAVAPSNSSVIYALAQGSGLGVNNGGGVWRSTDGGSTWYSRNAPSDTDDPSIQPNDFTRDQAWYDLVIAVDPNNPDVVIAGGVNVFMTTDGAQGWAKIGQENPVAGKNYSIVHADQHAVTFAPGSSSRVVFGCDGGVYYTDNLAAAAVPQPVIQPRIKNYNITQYYSCAMHPGFNSNYFLAGAQDNGTHQFTMPGINTVTEKQGGDGAMAYIDQLNSNYQFVSSQFNTIGFSQDGGATFTSVTNNATSEGEFINPGSYDSKQKILFTGYDNYNLQRINVSTGTPSISYLSVSLGSNITHLKVSPYAPTGTSTVYAGTVQGKVYKITNAHAGTPTVTNITSNLPAGAVSCVEIGASENTLLVTFSNYGVVSVWLSTNGGTTWTNKEGNLPDMPIRWALFNPNNLQQVLLATSVGVWTTTDVNAAPPDWTPTNLGLASVRVDMLQYRTSDKVVAAATFGRGLYTTDVFSSPFADLDADKKVVYTGNTIQFLNASLASTSWSWNFGDASTSTLQNPTHSYSAAGKYNVTLTINSGASTITKNNFIHVLPTLTPPYLAADGGNFETNPDHFGSLAVTGSANIWERGVPGNTLTTVSSPVNAWKTGLITNIPAAAFVSALLSPNFNLSAAGQYKLKFKKSVETYYCNGPYAVQVHYSTDKGIAWQRLGAYNDGLGINWYNKDPNAASCFIWDYIASDKQGWAGISVSNQNTEYNISSLSGNANVSFRIVMYNTGGYPADGYKDGFMVDDFEVTYQGVTAGFTAPVTVSFINKQVQFTDASISPTSWLWNFGDGNTSTLQNPTNIYTAPGKYNVTLTINSGASTITKNNFIHILPNRNIPYAAADGGNFESNADDFGSMAITGNLNIWERGVPGNVLNVAPSPVNVWKTGLNVNVTDATYSCALVSPNFNLSVAGTYTLKFKKSMRRYWNNGPYAVQVQYSTDKGTTWQRLGAYNDGNGTNWYNKDPNDANALYVGLFAGEKQGWLDWVDNQNTEYNISSLAGQTDVAFRVVIDVLKDWGVDAYKDGILIDDFEVLGPPSVADITAPVVATLAPANGATGVSNNTNLIITFDENVQKGTGNIIIKENGSTTQTIAVGSGNVTVSGKILTIDPTDFSNNIQVNIEMASGVIKDIAGNNFAGLTPTDWVFTTTAAPVVYCTSGPTSNADGKIDKVVFGTIDNNTTASGCVTYSDFTNLSTDVSPLQVVPLTVILGSCGGAYYKDVKVFIDWNGDGDFVDAGENAATSNIHGSGTYTTTVTIPATATPGIYTRMRLVCREKLNSETAQQFIDAILPCGSYGWGETEDYTVHILQDTQAPTVTTYTPANGAADISVSANLSILFSENIQKGTGNIIIKENSVITQTIPVGGANVTVSNNTVTIDPADFSNGVQVSVEIAAGVFKDMANNNFTGVAAGQWAFNTVAPLTILADFNSDKTQSCLGQQVIFSPQTSGTVTTYSWDFGNGATPATANTAGPHTVTYNTAGLKTVSLTVTGPAGSNTAIKSAYINVFQVTLASTIANVTCNGGNNGSVALTAAGGTTPYAFSWNTTPVQTTSSISNVVAGTFLVTVTDGLQCTATGSYTVTQPNAITITVSKLTNISCSGGNNGAVEISVTGGITPYSYSWSNTATTQNISNLTQGTYTVTVKDANNCTKTNSSVITQPAQLTLSVASTVNPTCGQSDGKVNTTTGGGTTPYTYLWSNGATTANLAGLSAGTYSATVTDAKGCTATTNSTLTPPGSPTVTISGKTNVSCSGGNNGSISITVTGGTAPYAYSWSNGATTQNISGIVANNYSVTVTDAGNCSFSITSTITEPSMINVSATSVSNVSCNGGSNGSILISVTGGTSPYAYSWSDGKTTQNNSNLTLGNYSVTVTDINGCTKSSAFAITEPSPISITVKTIQHVSCKGGANGSVSFNISGGIQPYSFNWSKTVPPPPQNTPVNAVVVQGYTNLTADAYQIIVTDSNGCNSSFSVVITEPSQLTVNAGSKTDVSCNGGNNGSASLTVNGGTSPYLYSWSNGATTQNVSNLTAATYTVTVTDTKGCTGNLSAVITEPSLLTVGVSSQVNASCSGASNGSIALNVSGGTTPYSFLWSNGSPVKDPAGLAAGTYTVTATDAKGCTNTASATITEAAAIVITPSQTNVTCNGGNNGTINITVTGGTAPYSYSWSNNSTTQNISGITSGQYVVTVTAQGGCIATKTITITQPSPIGISSSKVDNSGCVSNDGSITISVSGGIAPYIYNWSNGSTTQNINGLSAGSYTVTVTDNNSCIKLATSTITQPGSLLVILNAKTNITCNGAGNGMIDINVSGGTLPYTYIWSNAATSDSITGLGAGAYTVTVTDAGSCVFTYSNSVTEPGVLSASVSGQQNVSCFNGADGSINISVTGGTSAYSYNWTNAATTEDISGLIQGSYTVTVTDAKGCQATTSATVTQPAQMTASATVTNVACNGGNNGAITLSVTDGIIPYTYNWSTGASTQNISSLLSGNYSVTITDSKGCQVNLNKSVTQPQPLTVAASVTNMSCAAGGIQNGSINLNVTGGTTAYSYLWTTSATTQNVSNLTSGTYAVTVTDANSCTKVNSSTVSQPPSVNIIINNKKDPTCFGGSNGMIDIGVSGGSAPYNYTWSNGASTQDLLNLPSGSYTVVVTDNNNCNNSLNVTLVNPSDLIINLVSQTNVNCFGNNNGAASISVTGGTSPYSYSWSPSGGTAATAVNLGANDYFVTVTDAVQCTKSTKITITQPQDLTAIVDTVVNVVTCGASDGAINISSSGGISPYSYQWSNGATSQNISNLSAGFFSVTITDANSCSEILSTSVTQPGTLSASLTQTNVSCNGGNNGSVSLTVTGGASPYTFIWSDGKTTQNISSLVAGNYNVTITDNAGCKFNTGTIIAQPATLVANVAKTNISCFGGNNGAVQLTVSGGTAAYSYLWNTGATNQNLSNLVAGNYSVSVTDQNNCSTQATAQISEPAQLNTTIISKINNLCFGGNNGSISLTVTGGSTPYSFMWTNNSTVQSPSNLVAGPYSVTVTDANSCTSVVSTTITQPQQLVASVKKITNVSCNGGNDGAVELNVSGGVVPYIYNWSNGAGSLDINTLTAGIYSVTVKDVNGCVANANATVTEPAQSLDAVTASTAVSCAGSDNGTVTLTVSGGTSPYAYTWSNGATTQNLSALAAGNYGVTVTDSKGCTGIASAAVNQSSTLVLNVNKIDVACNSGNNGTINLIISGGATPYTFLWSNSSSTKDISGLIAGTYSVTVTDANGCTANNSGTITEPSVISSSAIVSDNTACGTNDGAIDLTVSGGISPYNYLWSNDSVTQDLVNLAAGIFYVTITDANGCSAVKNDTVTQPGSLASSTAVTNVSCTGGNNGAVNLTVSFGTAPYTYLWSSGNTTEDISGITAGSYAVTISDAASCQLVASVNITEPNSLSLWLNKSDVDCYGNSNGSVNLTVSGGTAAYTYLWSNGSSTQNISGLTPDSYTVTVTDANGCDAANSTLISQPSQFTVNIISKTNVNCFGGSNGAINTSSGGGVSPFSYLWSGGATVQNPSGLSAGNHSVTITDINGCTASNSAVLTEPGDLILTNSAVNVTSNGGSDGSIDLTVSGGIPSYMYLWNNGASVEDISGLAANAYTVTVTDANGCSKAHSDTITQPSSAVYCSGTTMLTAPIDSFSDGSNASDYSNNTDCKWLIEVSGASSVTLSFTSFATQINNDVVKVFDGNTTSSPLLGTYSGTNLPGSIASSGGAMLVQFLSDATTTAAGWDAQYTSTIPTLYCSGTDTLTASSGTIVDGSGINDYLENSDCKWLIQPAGATSITLTITQLNTENGYDLISVYDGNTVNAPLLAYFSGSVIPAPVTSSTGQMLVHFTSDYSVNMSGWSADYTSSTVVVTLCSGTTNLTSPSGTFEDGSGTANYKSNSDCSWLIQPSGATSITLGFTTFNTENGYDFVNVYQGIDETGTLIVSSSGSTIPNEVTSIGSSMFVQFTSDSTVNADGWFAYYNSDTTPVSNFCSGASSLTNVSGLFSDGSGSMNYLSYTNCSWLMQPAGATYITLDFTSFDIEDGYDYVYVYEGGDSTGLLLAAFTGSTLPSTVTAIGDSMFVQFISDNIINNAGWDASYNSFTGTPSYCQALSTLTDPSGTFSDGSGTNDYYQNSDCQWLIQPANASSITLSFTSFNTEAGYDSVVVYDGVDVNAPILMIWWGDTLPPALFSSGGSLLVHFQSDATVNAPGWEANYTSVISIPTYCSGTVPLTASSDSFSDGSATNDYAENSNCSWLIQPAGAAYITLNFTSFSTETDYDFVYVYQGVDSTAPLLAFLSGSSIPQTITATGGSMFVQFVSDYIVNAAGWDAYYNSSTSQLSFCSGQTTLTSPSGSFSDGSGLSDYLPNSDCSWLIQPANATSVTLTFTSFGTESGYDFVYVYDGSDSTTTQLGAFSGTTLPSSISSTGGSMFVLFVSDSTINNSGWSADYTSIIGAQVFCSGTTNLTAVTDTFSDGSGASDYLENSNCSWLIQPVGANNVTLHFTNFDVENGYDFVNVYDGADGTAPLLAAFTGSSLPPPVSSTGNTMFVQFTSDYTVNSTGWDAYYDTTVVAPFGCSGLTTLTTPTGSFDDGSGASEYLVNTNCEWLIQPVAVSNIALHFTAFNTESGYDFVKVYDGTSSGGSLLGSFSGNTLPPVVTATSGAMFVQFTSDGSVNADGWAAYYDTTYVAPFGCSGTTTLTNSSDCFSDGSDTSNYLDNADCKWLIQPTGATTITLTFSSFITEAGYDSVMIYDGATTSDPLLLTWWGNTLPPPVVSSGGSMLVWFLSDFMIDTAGWDACYTSTVPCSMTASATGTDATCNGCTDGSADLTVSGGTLPLTFSWSNSATTEDLSGIGAGTYTVTVTDNASCTATASATITEPLQYCSGTATLVATSGTFSDGSGLNNYADYSDCKWLIQPSGATSITLTFTAFDTESGYDSVMIYDGATTLDPVLLTWWGNTLPPPVVSTGGSMLVWFLSDNTVNAAGWDASYTSTIPCTMTASVTGSDATCNGCTDGSADLTVSGGTAPYTYNWLSGEITEDLSNIGAGTYNVTVTDALSCTATASVTITEPLQYCSGTVTLTLATDTFDDGSGPVLDYAINSDCYWLIQPPGASNIVLNFISFDTEQDYDSVTIYDGATTLYPILGSYSGSTLPPMTISSGGSLLVAFWSDFTVTAPGWEASYTIIVQQGMNNNMMAEVKTEPNPNNGLFRLLITSPQSSRVEIEMYNLVGQRIWSDNFMSGSGKYDRKIDITAMPEGIYTLSVNINGSRLYRKVVRE
ncbi:MAG: Ig-like domain-containing protein [Bacteroidetes bacterium]|nr:Ig-like domain-containing protein [Bacteroidota bacterium]